MSVQTQAAVVQPPADPYVLPAATGHLPKSIVMYQYEVCPFCCKVKAFLDYNKVCDVFSHQQRVCVRVSCGGGRV